MKAALLRWTVWRFTSPSTGTAVVVARRAETNDLQYQHQYQTVLGQVWAYNAEEALAEVRNEGTKLPVEAVPVSQRGA